MRCVQQASIIIKPWQRVAWVATPILVWTCLVCSIFFKTKECLRDDQSSCYTEDSPYYDVTHNGLDAVCAPTPTIQATHLLLAMTAACCC
jgi:hypothetical protein